MTIIYMPYHYNEVESILLMKTLRSTILWEKILLQTYFILCYFIYFYYIFGGDIGQ